MSTTEFPAVAEEEHDAGSAPRPKGYTPIPDWRNGISFGVFGPAVITQADRDQPLTQAELEDRAAVDAAMAADPLPNGELPPLFSSGERHQ